MSSPTPSSAPEDKSQRAFIISVSLAVAVCISAAFLGIALRGRSLIKAEILNRARADFHTILQVRAWSAAYNGVYVEKTPGVVSNPYLENPDIHATNGKTYTQKNPALITRELSERMKQAEGYGFHITSLKPINPGNKADPEEEIALRAFATGTPERIWTEQIGGRSFTRYMAPLRVDQTCLKCHAQQGYKVGDIRGGISFSYDTQDIQEKLRTNFYLVALLAVLTTGFLMALVLFFFRQLIRKLAEARHELMTFAMTDPLTGLFNRRHLLERSEQECERANRGGDGLCCLMLDIDFFKQVNDDLGHQVGDEVLKMIAAQCRAALRTYDVVGRYGGDEFVAVLPRTSLETARIVAERLRASVEATETLRKANGDRHIITVSLGLSQWKPFDTVETMLRRADEALYRAKAAGRNRMEIVDP